jgi:hypothetical protein
MLSSMNYFTRVKLATESVLALLFYSLYRYVSPSSMNNSLILTQEVFLGSLPKQSYSW